MVESPCRSWTLCSLLMWTSIDRCDLLLLYGIVKKTSNRIRRRRKTKKNFFSEVGRSSQQYRFRCYERDCWLSEKADQYCKSYHQQTQIVLMIPQYNPDRHRLSWTDVVTFELITILFCGVCCLFEFRSVVMLLCDDEDKN